MISLENVIAIMGNQKAFYWYLSTGGNNVGYYPINADDQVNFEDSKNTLETLVNQFPDGTLFQIKMSGSKTSSSNRCLEHVFSKIANSPVMESFKLSGFADNGNFPEGMLKVKQAEMELSLQKILLAQREEDLKKRSNELAAVEKQYSTELGWLVNTGKGAAKEVLFGVLGKLLEHFKGIPQAATTAATAAPLAGFSDDPRADLVQKIAENLYNSSLTLTELKQLQNSQNNGRFHQSFQEEERA